MQLTTSFSGSKSAESEKKKEEKPFMYVMSPYELEQYARQVLAEQED